MKNKIFALFVLISFLSPSFSQKITIINKTIEAVTVKIQNEVTFDFDRLTLGPEAVVDFESSTQRRVILADTIHFFAINELKKGDAVITIHQLSAKTKKSSDTVWNEDDDTEGQQEFTLLPDTTSAELSDTEEKIVDIELPFIELDMSADVPADSAIEAVVPAGDEVTEFSDVEMLPAVIPASDEESPAVETDLSDDSCIPVLPEETPLNSVEETDDEELKIF